MNGSNTTDRNDGAALNQNSVQPVEGRRGAPGDTTREYVSLTDAAKITPGRPTANCVWRWCRRGVRARNGERVRLRHIRMGGMMYTTAGWLDEFGRRLAEADARHFDSDGNDTPTGTLRQPTSRSQQRRREIESAERELDESGIR